MSNNPVARPGGGGTPDGTEGLASAGIGIYATGKGPKLSGVIGVGGGLGTGKNPGSGGNGFGFGPRGQGHIPARLAGEGGTKYTERAVIAALIWLARHQNSEGNWRLEKYTEHCDDGGKSCTGTGRLANDTAATAFGLLPFLAAGQTHKARGPYREVVRRGLEWLIKRQARDGNLAPMSSGNTMMYSHGLATIALCEAYGMTGDHNVCLAAQGAVNFIVNAQNESLGSWRYTPKVDGDTSVFGWQVMALKSAHMAGLIVPGSNTFGGASKWLDSVATGSHGSEFCYIPGQPPSQTMTAVGLLCRQYLGASATSP